MRRSGKAVLAALDQAIASRGGEASVTLADLARLLLPAWQAELDRVAATEVRPPQRVSCRIGCSACCHHPIPLSIPEAFMLAELVAGLPASARARVLGAQEYAVVRLRNAGLLSAPLLSRGTDYVALGLPCPFLVDATCSIHARRPSACREHLVVSPPELCRTLDGGALPIGFPYRLTEVLATVAARLLGGAPTQIPLIHALAWAAANADAGRRAWPLDTLRRELAESFGGSLA